MNSILAFPVYVQQSGTGAATGVGASGEHTVAMDLFVLINLAFLMFMLGFFACWAWLIWRRTTRPPPHIQLIMELDDEDEEARKQESTAESTAPSSSAAEPEPERAPWEREQDWWKK